MSFVRTVLGDIAPESLGVCYAHEHIVIDESHTTEKTPDFLLNDVERIVAELAQFVAAGGRSMVDSMPGGGAGRNVRLLAEVSGRSGVQIVCPTGLHLPRYYPRGHWSSRLGAEAMADLFIDEIELGIDFNDLAGPAIQRSGHRAGVIKVAMDEDVPSVRERAIFAAACIAQRRTGAPILTHTEQGRGALEQIELLQTGGADLHHVVLSHCDRRYDVESHRRILRSGVRVEYDSAFRWKKPPNHTLDLVVALIEEFPGQIMLGMDAARRGYWSSFGGSPGLAYLLTDFSVELRRAGVSDEALHRMFVVNPRDAYQFSTRER